MKRRKFYKEVIKPELKEAQLELFGFSYEAQENATKFVNAVIKLHEVVLKYRKVVYTLAGCELDDWSLEELENYVNLGRRTYNL